MPVDSQLRERLLRPGQLVSVSCSRAKEYEGHVRTVFADRFELELLEVMNPDEHYSNISAPAVYRTITIYFEDLLEIRKRPAR